MEKLDRMIEKVISPPRVNTKNMLFEHKRHFQDFEFHEFNIITFDRHTLPVIFFKNKNANSFVTTAIYSHSYGSSKYEGIGNIPACKKYKLNYCVYDSRGCGNASPDSKVSFGFNEKIDLLFLLLKLNFDF